MNLSHRIKLFLRVLGVIGVLLSMSANPAGAQELSMGWEDWQPYQYMDSNQVVTGLDIELMQAILTSPWQ